MFGAAATAVVLLVLLVLIVLLGVITPANLSLVTVAVIVHAAVAYFAVMLTSHKVDQVERRRVTAFIPLFLAGFVFFSLYQQQFAVVVRYVDERLNRTLFGWELPIAWANSINPIFIILLAGVFAALWTKLGPRQPSAPVKFAMGTVLMGLAFLTFLVWAGGTGNSTPLWALVFILLLSPVGLSLATKLAPRAFQTQMVALNFLSIALGTATAGSLAGERGAVLPHRRRRRGRLRRAALAGDTGDQETDVRGAVTTGPSRAMVCPCDGMTRSGRWWRWPRGRTTSPTTAGRRAPGHARHPKTR